MIKQDMINKDDAVKSLNYANAQLLVSLSQHIDQIKASGGYLTTQKAISIVKTVRKKKDISAAISNAGGKTSFIDRDVVTVVLHGLLERIFEKYPEFRVKDEK